MRPFSPLWFFDRCQEGSYFTFPFIAISTVVLVLIGLWWVIRLQQKNLFLKSFYAAMTLIAAPIYFEAMVMVALIVGFFVLDCAAHRRFWPYIAPATQLNGHLNHLHTFDQPLLQTENELRAMFPAETQQVEQHMRLRYSYIPETNDYVFVVRPSRYLVIVNNSATGYQQVFRTPVWPRAGFTSGSGMYPEQYGPLP